VSEVKSYNLEILSHYLKWILIAKKDL